VERNAEIPFDRFEHSVTAAASLDIPERARGVLESLTVRFATCEVWPSVQAPAIETLPVTGDVPTLMLAGA